MDMTPKQERRRLGEYDKPTILNDDLFVNGVRVHRVAGRSAGDLVAGQTVSIKPLTGDE